MSAKLRATRNRLALTRRKSPVLTSLQLGLGVPAVVAFTSLLTIGFASAMSQTRDHRAVVTMLAAMIAFATIGAFIGSSTSALQALYLADDIPFLLTLPIPLRTLYASKLVEAMTGAFPPAILSTSCLLAYGLVNAETAAYWLLTPVVLVAMTVTATACAVMTVSGVTRYIPPRRARLFLLAISLFIIAMTAIGWQALAPGTGAIDSVAGNERLDPLRTVLAWTPAGWSAEGMAAVADGSWGRATLFALAVVTTAAGALVLSFHAFRRTFLRGLARTQAVQAAEPSRLLTGWLDRASMPLPRRFGALVLKEWLVLFRDLRRLSGAIWPVGIVLMYTVLLGRGGSDYGSDAYAFWSRFGSLALLPWGLSLGISVYSYGSEGRNISLLRSLPCTPRRVFAAKVVASLLPVGVFSIGVACAALWLRSAPLGHAVQLLGLLAWMITGFVVIDTAAAATAPNFETDQVQRTISLTGRLFGFALGGIFTVATLPAAARAILYTGDQPRGLTGLLDLSVGGIQPFGWPLIAVCAAAAAGVVTLAATIAISRTEHLLTSGD